MSSERRIRSSQENGRRSHGPVTPEGRASSAQAHIIHCLTANTIVLSNEDQDRFQEHLDQFVVEFQPRSRAQFLLVEQMAVNMWKIRRSWGVESALYDHEMDRMRPDLAAKYEQIDEPTRLALAYSSLHESRSSASNLERQQVRLIRQYERSMALLNDLQARKRRRSSENTFLNNQPSPKNGHSGAEQEQDQ